MVYANFCRLYFCVHLNLKKNELSLKWASTWGLSCLCKRTVKQKPRVVNGSEELSLASL